MDMVIRNVDYPTAYSRRDLPVHFERDAFIWFWAIKEMMPVRRIFQYVLIYFNTEYSLDCIQRDIDELRLPNAAFLIAIIKEFIDKFPWSNSVYFSHAIFTTHQPLCHWRTQWRIEELHFVQFFRTQYFMLQNWSLLANLFKIQFQVYRRSEELKALFEIISISPTLMEQFHIHVYHYSWSNHNHILELIQKCNSNFIAISTGDTQFS
jgi:hypothetical protein